MTLEYELPDSELLPSRSAVPPIGPSCAHELLKSFGVADKNIAEEVSRLSLTSELPDRRKPHKG